MEFNNYSKSIPFLNLAYNIFSWILLKYIIAYAEEKVGKY